MKLIGRLLSIMILFGALVALCLPADAGAYLYSGKRKKVYCGIVEIVDPISGTIQNNDAISSAALLFAKLDALNSMKPAGWTFENPLAVSQNKLDPQYWRIRVSSARNLSRMNVLYFPGSGNISLTDEERENLRRFVDGGGTLWVDNVNPNSPLTFDAAGPLFISQLGFKIGPSGAAAGTDVASYRHHPLLCSPYWLTDVDIMSLGMNASGGGSRGLCDMGKIDLGGKQPTSFDILFPIVESSDGSSVVANTYGSGRVVATANGVGGGCMLPEPYSLASLKFAFNIMSYASSWTDIRKNPRHTGSSIDTLGSNRLVEKWWIPTSSSAGKREIAPLIYKNTVFYTSGDTLCAMDQNGDTHGGMWPAGPHGEVVIWQWTGPAGGALSSPTIATIQDPNKDCGTTEAVMVMNEGGTVFVLNAFPINPDNTIQKPNDPLYFFETAAGTGGESSKWPSPPIYVNGWIYALGGDGRLFAVNPCLEKWESKHKGTEILGSSSSWQCPDLLRGPYASTPRCGPSFGYMKNVNSGAVVGVVYWFDSPKTAPLPLDVGDLNDHICGVPVSVSMDRARIQMIDTTRTHAQILVTYSGELTAPDPNDPKSALRLLKSDGITPVIVTDVQLNKDSAGGITPGSMYITTGEPIPSGVLIYATYTLSYGPTRTANVLGGEIEPKSAPSTGSSDMTHPPTIIAGTPAMGPDNMLFLTARRDNPGPSGGSILAYRNDGGISGTGKLKWHYFLHSGVSPDDSAGYAPGTDIALPGVVMGSGGPMYDPQPSSSPAVAGGKLFVTVSGKIGEGPAAALLCLRSNPEFVIRLTESGGYDASGSPIKRPKSLWKKTDQGHYNVRIWQPNLINTAGSGIPLMDARDVSSGGDSSTGVNVDYDSGTITFSDFSLTKLQKMMVSTNTFSPSLPVWVYLDNVEVPIDWSTWGPGALDPKTGLPAVDPSTGLPYKPPSATSDSVDLSGWNNLLWYYIVSDHACTGAHSPPVVIGTTVYFVCDDGYLYALDTESGESSGKPTTQQPIWKTRVAAGNISKDAPVSVAGSNGVLMVPGPDGLHAFTDTTTLVTDNSRVVEIDGGGEVTWSVDSISWPAATPSSAGQQMAMKQGPVNKPGRARYANTGEILFANSGANQVCKIDKSGMVGFDGASGQYIRWVYDKFADPKHLLRTGQPTQLRAPTDAIMWQEMEPLPTTGPKGTPGTSVVHCLIADSGNSRILDLVYRVSGGRFVAYDQHPIDPANNVADEQYIDPDSKFVLPELNWVSKTDSLNERYAFDCLQLVPVTRNDNFCQDIWVASSNYAAAGASFNTSPTGGAGLGGAILAIGYRQRPQTMDTAPGAWTYDDPDPAHPTSGRITARCDHIELNGKVVPLANPRFFDVIQPEKDVCGQGLNLGLSLLVCDNYGVYRAEISGNGAPKVVAHLLVEDYAELRRLPDPASLWTQPPPPAPQCEPPPPGPPVALPVTSPLMAACVQKLPNGNWLITNGYSGSNTTGARNFGGEVFEYDPCGPVTQEVTWCSPRLEWVKPPPCTLPTDWRQITANTYNLRQPRSAFRQL